MKIIVKDKEYELEDLHITGNGAEEKEVTVSSVSADSCMRVYTSDDTWLTKIKKCVIANPKDWRIVNLTFRKDGTLSGVTAEAPRGWLILRTKERTCTLTPEQIKENTARLKESHAAKAKE
mgnify:CR=1 FL=1